MNIPSKIRIALYCSLLTVQTSRASISCTVKNESQYEFQVKEIQGFKISDNTNDKLLFTKLVKGQSIGVYRSSSYLNINYPIVIKWATSQNSTVHESHFERIYPLRENLKGIEADGEIVLLYRNNQLHLLWNDSPPVTDEKISDILNTTSSDKNQDELHEFQSAIKHGDLQKVKKITSEGFNLESELPIGLTPLIASISAQQTEITFYLLKMGANPNSKIKYYNRSALMLALFVGNEAIARELIKRGANLKELDKDKNTVLFYAVAGKATSIIPELLKAGLSVHTTFSDNRTLLMCASQFGNVAYAKVLLDQGFDINKIDSKGKTALMYACFRGEEEMIRFLIKNGANLSLKDDSGLKAVYMLGYLVQEEGRNDLIPMIQEMLKLENNKEDIDIFRQNGFIQ